MPHYFFQIRDEQSFPDLLGVMLSDPTAARCEALALAGCLLAEPEWRFQEKTEWSIDVMDRDENLLFRLIFYRGLGNALPGGERPTRRGKQACSPPLSLVGGRATEWSGTGAGSGG